MRSLVTLAATACDGFKQFKFKAYMALLLLLFVGAAVLCTYVWIATVALLSGGELASSHQHARIDL
jgi:hypothetical protein